MANIGGKYRREIARRGLSIYDDIRVGDPDLWIPNLELERMLNDGLRGLDLKGLPIRTRSKVVKSKVCEIIGYPVPIVFKKTRPRFPGQNFDTYVQQRNNLQVWNEELSATRRYVLIRVSPDCAITRVRVVDGATLALLDTTGTLTQKYQAALVNADEASAMFVEVDTDNLRPLLANKSPELMSQQRPTDEPTAATILSISTIFNRLRPLVGREFRLTALHQERNRGGVVHKLVCLELGYTKYLDNGQFPDVRNQLLEIKLQTSRTIDLGLVCPDSTEPLGVPLLDGHQIRHCDVRYGIFYARLDGLNLTLTNFYLTTGEAFFRRFRRFEGKILNKKLQIPLPAGFL